MSVPVTDGRKSVIKVRVNEHNKIMLDGKIDGKRYRLSTGKEANKRNLDWYSSHADDEFFKLYKKKYDVETSKLVTFEEYGLKVLQNSKKRRNQFSQKEELQRHRTLCETFGKKCVTAITASDIEFWQNNCGFAYKTILNYRSTLNRILKRAYFDRLLPLNPLEGVEAPVDETTHLEKKNKIRTFTEEEIDILLSNTRCKKLENLLLFNMVSGLRASEIIALQWDHIDFENKKILVRDRTRQGDVDYTKHFSVRLIDMLPKAYQALKAQWEISHKSKYVFITKYGKPYTTEKSITKQVKRLCEKCNIEHATLKTTRKTCNTLYKQNDLNIEWILDQLGHSSEGVNRKHYTGRIRLKEDELGRVLAGLSK